MSTYSKQSTYGIGLESVTAGTKATAFTGVPQEGLIKFDTGEKVERVDQFRGVAFKHANELKANAKAPKADGFKHNWNITAVLSLLASMHQFVGNESTSLFTLECPTTGADVSFADAYDDIGVGSLTLTAGHQIEGTNSMLILGCIPSMLKITFPANGGPVKMEYNLVGMNALNQSAVLTLAIDTATGWVDLLTSDFYFKFGTIGSPDQFYPDLDVVLTFTPRIESLFRTHNYTHQHIIHGWDATFEFALPVDGLYDVDGANNTLHELYADMTRKELLITTESDFGDPAAMGDIEIKMRGGIETMPSLEGDGILKEKATFTCSGTSAATVYRIRYFTDTMF